LRKASLHGKELFLEMLKCAGIRGTESRLYNCDPSENLRLVIIIIIIIIIIILTYLFHRAEFFLRS